MSHLRAKRRRGYTLMELVVSMSSATLLMTGLASALIISTSSFNLDSGTQSKTATAAQVQADMMADLQHALSFSERTATAATFTVPDRDGDTNPETIRYAWSGTPGDPLTYQYNGGTVVNVAEDVQSFDLSYLTRTMLPFDCAPPTFEEFTETKQSSGTETISLTTPSGTMEGDLLIAALATDEEMSDHFVAPAGWTLIAKDSYSDDVALGVWWKIAGASEPSSHTFTWYDGETEEAYGWMMRFTGHDPDNPIHAFAVDTNGNDYTPNSPAVTTTIDNALILRLGAFDDDNISHNSTGLSGHTTITMDESGSGDGTCSGGAGYEILETAGDSGTEDFSLNDDEQSVTITVAIAGAGCSGSSSAVDNVLFVVTDSSSISSEESARKTQLEAWGYTVNLISDDASQATFDAALAVNDVVYFSEDIDSGSLSTKVRNASIGVVSGEPYMIDETGFASSYTLPTITSIDVTNGSHYITSTFGTGSLTILSSSQEGQCASGTLAGGLSTLAEIDDGGTDRPALAVIDTGGSLYSSGTAAGRRVQLPWGGGGFNFSALNSDGLTLLKRSLEWAAGAGDEGGGSVVYHEFTETKDTSAGTNITVAKPAGTVVGDLLIAGVAIEEDNKSYLSGPAGWTELYIEEEDDQVAFGVWWKIADGSEPSSYTFDWSGGTSEHSYGWIMRFTGHDPTNPINVSSWTNGTSSSPTSPAITTTVNNALVLRLAGVDSDNINEDDTGLTGHTDITMDQADGATGGAGYTYQATAGDTGTDSFSLTGEQQWVTVTIGIAPAP